MPLPKLLALFDCCLIFKASFQCESTEWRFIKLICFKFSKRGILSGVIIVVI
jgi:hypothetical protein